MSTENYTAALAEIETAASRVAPHLKSQGAQVNAAGFLGGLASVLVGIFLKALTDQLMEEAKRAGTDVVKWVVGQIRAYFKEDPKAGAGEMSIMPHIPTEGSPANAERVLMAALADFLPAGDAARLARAVRAAVETHLR